MASLSSVQKAVAVGLVAVALGGWGYAFTQSGEIARLKVEALRAEDERGQLETSLAKAQKETKRVKAALEKKANVGSRPIFSNRGSFIKGLRERGFTTIRRDEQSADLETLSEVEPETRSLEELLASDNPNDREDAVDALAESGRPDALELLAVSLDDLDEDVREAAIDGLARIGGDEAAEALSAGLRDTEAWNREEAVDALVKIGGDKAAQSLAVALDVNDKPLRLNAVKALGAIGGAEAVKVLELALQDNDPAVRQAAVEALEEIGGETAMELIESAQENETEVIQ